MDHHKTQKRGNLELLKRFIFDLEDRIFEKWHGAEFSGYVLGDELSFSSNFSATHATAYQQIWCRSLDELIKTAYKLGFKFENFVDIGSGKGKACLYAFTKKKFTNIIGVELSEPLLDIAQANLKKIRANNVSFVSEDALKYRLPQANNLVFLFNPFDEIVLEAFINNNIDHFINFSSLIAYANDVQRDTLARMGFDVIFRNEERKNSILRYVSKGSLIL
ncbi:MAG: class I SAM-dependent methyltransferase [Bacteroidetes bacterium]|nr:class I SAM-dependent methyltransferase [Bacteroidota bacterium]